MMFHRDLGDSVREFSPDGFRAEKKRECSGAAGDCYRQNLSLKARVAVRVLFVALFGWACFMYVICSIQSSAVNSAWYVALMQAIAFPLLFWTMIALFLYVLAPAMMSESGYRKSSVSLLKSSGWATVALSILVLASVIAAVVPAQTRSLHAFLFPLGYSTAALAMLVINRIENRIEYTIVEGEDQCAGTCAAPENSGKEERASYV